MPVCLSGVEVSCYCEERDAHQSFRATTSGFSVTTNIHKTDHVDYSQFIIGLMIHKTTQYIKINRALYGNATP